MLEMKNYKHILVTALLTLLFLNFPVGNVAYAETYNYNLWDDVIPAPDAYEWKGSIRAEDLGIEAITNISDIFYANNKIYIALDGMIIITDEEFNTQKIISEYVRDSKSESVSTPKSVFATASGDIYISEPDKGEIIQFDENGDFVRAIGNPGITGMEDLKFTPTKVVVDSVGRIYVQAENIYEGIIELNPQGKFNRFLGANEVKPSPLEIFYRSIATDEQISRMKLWLPTDYSDIAIDKEGFLMASIRDTSTMLPVRKINYSGDDVLNEFEFITPPMGDYINRHSISALTAIATSEDGRFAVLDSNMSRVFVYSEEGILAYIIGGSGKRQGELTSAVDVEFCGDNIVVADLITCSIEIFSPTKYGELINQALVYQSRYDYTSAAKYWKQAYDINPNSIVVNMGLGKYQLRSGDYKGAMKSFEATGERESYSAAYEVVREKLLEQYLGWIILAFILFILMMKILSSVIKNISKDGVFDNNRFFEMLRSFRKNFFTWPGYLLSHPFKAFDDIKYQNAGSTSTCVFIMLLFAWMTLIKTRYSGFLVNFYNTEEINIPLILVSSVCPYLIFVVANWAIGVLIDGKGNLKNIFKVNMYALYPSLYLFLIGTLLSRFVIYEETALVALLLNILPIIVYVFYAFIGLVMVHQFSFTKGITSVLLSFVAMMIIIFIIVLLSTLISGFFNDVGTIVDEIILYM